MTTDPGPNNRPFRVLVVDDDEIIRHVLTDMLTDEGYDARAASNGRDALSILETWRSDLIVLDLMMPGMDGQRFREEQRRRPNIASIPVVLLSASRELPQRTASLAAAAVFPKPFDLEPLLATIKSLTSS